MSYERENRPTGIRFNKVQRRLIERAASYEGLALGPWLRRVGVLEAERRLAERDAKGAGQDPERAA
jgi:hypothetical protein